VGIRVSGGGAPRLFEDCLFDVSREGHVGILGCPLDQREVVIGELDSEAESRIGNGRTDDRAVLVPGFRVHQLPVKVGQRAQW
jgi:hypothetical protein